VLTHRDNYGYRRVSRELRDQGLVVNHKPVLRILQQDNLLAVRRRKFLLTTDARHDLSVYLNLAGRMQSSGIDQLW
jgi:transposase InsO family protein